MSNTGLTDSIQVLKDLACKMNEAALEKPWVWGSYDEEGVRFVFFRTLEELRSLAVRLAQARADAERPPSQAQRILAQYHTAYRDYEAAITGLEDAVLTQPPAEGEWPVQRAMAHILGADMGFYVLVRYALERHRTADGRPERFNDAVYETYFANFFGLNEVSYDELMEQKAGNLLNYHADLHQRILAEFNAITDPELELKASYWEKEPYPMRYRLGRFESHLRQHIIQIDKTLAALGRLPGEPLRLLRMVYAALAEAEGARLGAEEFGDDLVAETSGRLSGWINEVSDLLANG
jgi:hypothetical protein